MGQIMTTQTYENTQRSAPGLLSGLDAFAKQHQDTLLLIGRILLGLNHKKLTYRHNGRNERLTENAGEVIEKVLG